MSNYEIIRGHKCLVSTWFELFRDYKGKYIAFTNVKDIKDNGDFTCTVVSISDELEVDSFVKELSEKCYQLFRKKAENIDININRLCKPNILCYDRIDGIDYPVMDWNDVRRVYCYRYVLYTYAPIISDYNFNYKTILKVCNEDDLDNFKKYFESKNIPFKVNIPMEIV